MSRKIPEILRWTDERQAATWAEYPLEAHQQIIEIIEGLPLDEARDRMIQYDQWLRIGIDLKKTPDGRISSITVALYDDDYERVRQNDGVVSFINDTLFSKVPLRLRGIQVKWLGENMTEFYLVPSNRKINAKLRV